MSNRSGWLVAALISAFAAGGNAYGETCFAVAKSGDCRVGTIELKDAKPAKRECVFPDQTIAASHFASLAECLKSRKSGLDSLAGGPARSCFSWVGEGKSERCAAGESVVGNSGLCVVGDRTISEFYSDSKCKTYRSPTACWTYMGLPDADQLICNPAPGKIVKETVGFAAGVEYCVVGNRTKTIEFFYDDRCEKPALLSAKRKNPVSDQDVSGISRIKVLPSGPSCPPTHVVDPQSGACVVITTGETGAGGRKNSGQAD